MASKPVNLKDMTREDFLNFLDSFDHVFSDCDGVIWHISPYPRAGEFFNLMKRLGKTVNFVSNNSIVSPEKYRSKFEASGIENGYDNLTVPSMAIAEFLKSVNFKKTIFSISCRETNRMLESHGFKCKVGPDVGVEYYADFLQYLKDDPEIGAVVLDSDFLINMPKLYMASAYLKNPDVYFISGASDKWVPITKDFLTLGVGHFAEMLAEQSKRKPIELGKPGKLFAEFAMKRANVTNASRVLFIGDMIAQDIALGKAAGFKTLLLLTSLSYEDMMSEKVNVPDYYARNLEEIVPLLYKL